MMDMMIDQMMMDIPYIWWINGMVDMRTIGRMMMEHMYPKIPWSSFSQLTYLYLGVNPPFSEMPMWPYWWICRICIPSNMSTHWLVIFSHVCGLNHILGYTPHETPLKSHQIIIKSYDIPLVPIKSLNHIKQTRWTQLSNPNLIIFHHIIRIKHQLNPWTPKYHDIPLLLQ